MHEKLHFNYAIFEKSFKYIDEFLRGKSLKQGPVGELKKVVFGVHPEGQKWHIRKNVMNLANFKPFLGPKYLKKANFHHTLRVFI